MPFSMHSHSGQFCPGHAKDSLEEVVLQAIALRMRHFAMTEHMPRDQDKDLYPEEVAAGDTVASLRLRHETYIKEALRLRKIYTHEISIIIGFEGDWIRSSSASLVHNLLLVPGTDFFVGSVHHVHEIPIDFDKAMYQAARGVAGGTDERLFEDYFDAQFEMLKNTRPRVVGHFDLIRLLSEEPDRDLKSMEGVWERVKRNLELVREQGALIEINASALRKGLKEPYPGRSVCEEFLIHGGKLTLSDDSHGVAQVGLNFKRAMAYMQSLGVKDLYFLEKQTGNHQVSDSPIEIKSLRLTGLDLDHYPLTV